MVRIIEALSVVVLASFATALPKSAPAPVLHSAEFTDTVRMAPFANLETQTDTSFQFENVTVTPGESAVTRAGYQNGINYGQFQVDSDALTGIGPVKPASGKNVAVVLPTTTLESGSLSLNPQNTATKSAAIKYFSLLDFFFGCSTFEANSVTNNALGCGIEVSGYNTAGKMVPIASFNFAPDELVNADPAHAVLPYGPFEELVNVTFAVATSSGVVADTAIIIDNVTHINYFY